MGSQTPPNKIPVIDFSGENMKPGAPEWLPACHDVRRALEEYGCFIANYKTFPLELHNKLFEASKELFNLPYETKMKNVYEKPSHGYLGKNANLPLHEGMGIDRPTIEEDCKKFTDLMWPEGNDRFCETAYSYAKKAEELERAVMRMVFESYGIMNLYEAHRAQINYLMRFLSYRQAEAHESNVGFVTHTDKTFLSILHQNHVEGLELRTENGDWVCFEPSPSSFVVMVGDAFMAWSNGRIPSNYHRVALKGNEKRLSLGFFTFCSGLTQTPEELVDDEHPLLYKPFDHYKLLDVYLQFDPNIRAGRLIMKEYCGV